MNFFTAEDLKIQLKHLASYLFHGNNAAIGSYLQKQINDNPINEKYFSSEITGVFSSIREKEKDETIKALRENQGNVSKIAKQLEMNRYSVVYRNKKYNIK